MGRLHSMFPEHRDILAETQPVWWERLALLFCRRRYGRDPDTGRVLIEFKVWRGRQYLLKAYPPA